MPDPVPPVLIAGAGPTGLTAALELSRFGIPVRLVDKLPAPSTTSRALGVQARTLELMAQRGLADRFVERGNPGHGGNIYGGGALVFRLDFSRIESRYNYILTLSQAETEAILTEAVAAQGVKIERGVALVALSQDPHAQDASPVQAVLRHPDGRLEDLRASWLISAEGAHSLVRSTLDLQFEGKTLPDAYALGDLRIDGDLPASDFHLFSSDHGLLAMFPLGERHFRLIASNPIGDPTGDAPPMLAELQAVYDQRSHIPVRFHDLAWSSWFHINSRMVSRLRLGRLLLGGDAAHIHSPAGGQGMNTGIQDMINLGWKLAMVIRGEAQAALLDTYEQDRLPVMRHVLSRTEGLTGMIGSENPVVRSLFNHLGPWIGSAGIVQDNAAAQMSQIAVGYRDSPLSEQHGRGSTVHGGDRMPDLPVRVQNHGGWQDATLFGLLDPSRFVLVVAYAGEAGAGVAGLEAALRPWAGRIAVVEVAPRTDEPSHARYQATCGRSTVVFLVRPDGYVGLSASGHDAAGHLAAYCKRWLTPAA